jgi:hypothetical protein
MSNNRVGCLIASCPIIRGRDCGEAIDYLRPFWHNMVILSLGLMIQVAFMATKRKNEAVDTLRKEAPGRGRRELIGGACLHISNFPKQSDWDL